MKKTSLIILLLMACLTRVNAQLPKNQLDAIVNKYANVYMSDSNAVGLSVGIIQHGKKYFFNYGLVRKGKNESPTNKTIYAMGSIAKTFVGILLAQAVKDNKVQLTDDIRKYLKGDYPNLQFNNNSIRLVHLANHTARLPESLCKFPSNWQSMNQEEKYVFKQGYNREEFYKDLHAIKLDTVPGYKYSYSGSGMTLLKLILENVYQKPFQDLINQYFSKPLSLGSTKELLNTTEWESYAFGKQDAAIVSRTKSIEDMTTGPGLCSTTDDMVKYIQANILAINEAIKLSHQKTFEDNNNSMALAWRLDEQNNTIYHLGTGWGCNSICKFSPKYKTGIIIFVNETMNKKNMTMMANNILEELNKNSGIK
ncbi:MULTISPECIES: serine hydrolase [unclassified Arcicella]|uniref:serine hydrolase domain-containing protein n=1 Tax=unclassified Arcicella TaxID=2644986 RepID=UPI00285D313E|nr:MULTISPECIES: serine hydrolase [unclassified Arcicella]MDR6563185.1 CubicO group peptidase (beta-lactamase class C family) [Arcicella sp. BE51]MDR6811664.1 CubicO group peptidase (beta-lactamase class C family) [Arcicella sp. BE140]MDR6823189.1 CubicO group peptidase (beta-lactamase class C family) [Arcicella sp. BE139]